MGADESDGRVEGAVGVIFPDTNGWYTGDSNKNREIGHQIMSRIEKEDFSSRDITKKGSNSAERNLLFPGNGYGGEIMMKISKPIPTSEFMLSPVQFTSLNSILFKNIKNVYDGNERITLEYEHSAKIEASSRDWIGIFPRGWSTLQQYVTFEWVSQSVPCGTSEQNKENGEVVRRTITFCPKYHLGTVNNNFFYQFVYVSKQIEVLGVSSYFRFDLTAGTDPALELECLVPVSSKIRSTSVSDFGILLTNTLSPSPSVETRTLQTSSIHSLQNLDSEGKNWNKAQVSLNAVPDLKKAAMFSRKATSGTGDALDPYSSHSEPVFPMSFQTGHCKKCFHFKRGGEFLRSQQVLQSKVGPRWEEALELNGQRTRTLGHECLSEDKLKIVMERNKVLEERAQEMKKEMEKVQAESKRLKMSYYTVNKEKVAYEKFVKDFIKSLEKDSIVRVVNGNTEILVKKVNYVGMEEHPRDKKTSKRERELKAVIGLQEITIRNLINSLQEKAKSVQELNQTVKLAQAFSAARDDSRDYGSDAEEAIEEVVSNSDVTSEYEFSLTKPPPPEEVTVDETDAVLDDIRRASEMELKDIGINRSLGKSSSRDSELDANLPKLSVRSYQNQSEGTRPKKPRLFDNVEDCWPNSETSSKTVHRKVIESNAEDDEKEKYETRKETDGSMQDESKETESESSESVQCPNKKETMSSDIEVDPTGYEDYYDACEEESNPAESQQEADEEMAITEDKEEDVKPEKKNFLITAIIPQDLDVKPSAPKSLEDSSRVDKEEEDKKPEPVQERAKKFTCELSIDFASKRSPETVPPDTETPAIDQGHHQEETQNQVCNTFDPEKSLLTFKKSNKRFEIKITHDQVETANKNYLHQKMVVQFGNDAQPAADPGKPSKIEFNLAVTGLKTEANFLKPNDNLPLKLPPVENFNQEVDASPRTVWNDAESAIIEEEEEDEDTLPTPETTPRKEEEPVLTAPERPDEKMDDESKDEELKGGGEEEQEEEPEEDSKSCQDSLRYEKNLEFLQQKTEEKAKENEGVTKEKPSAILIQNGQTKLALIRYQ